MADVGSSDDASTEEVLTPRQLDDLSVWASRLRAATAPPWSVAAVASVFAPSRRAGTAIIDEMGLTLTALRVPEASLDRHPEQVGLLSAGRCPPPGRSASGST